MEEEHYCKGCGNFVDDDCLLWFFSPNSGKVIDCYYKELNDIDNSKSENGISQ